MLRRRYDSCRRRDHRGPCLDRRERHHGRVGSGDPRGGRRQKLRDGRYESIVGPDRRQSDRQAGREFPRQDDRAGRRFVPSENSERNRSDDSAGRIHAGIRDRLRYAETVCGLRGSQHHGSRFHLAVRLPDSDYDRRPALGDRYRRHGPRAARQCHYQVGQGRRNGRRPRYAAARQNRNHHDR